MRQVEKITELRELVRQARKLGQTIALVPTMGYLHAGHLELIRRANRDGNWVVVSIFVNPLQFGPNEDFTNYPRNLQRDLDLAKNAGAQVVFAPEVKEMYPEPCLTAVDVPQLGSWLCGRSRPGHFQGVCTVVSKLFNIVQPDRAYFGEKDAQQLAIIKQMVLDLNFPVEIVAVPIVREEDGLAKSSRNVYLNPEQRAQAPALSQALQIAKQLYTKGEKDAAVIKRAMQVYLAKFNFAEVDYIEIVDPRNLQPVTQLGAQALVAIAVRFGGTRLIDNTTLREE